jgi:hypothetical protein
MIFGLGIDELFVFVWIMVSFTQNEFNKSLQDATLDGIQSIVTP